MLIAKDAHLLTIRRFVVQRHEEKMLIKCFACKFQTFIAHSRVALFINYGKGDEIKDSFYDSITSLPEYEFFFCHDHFSS